jgi:GAF domain-containing protein
MEAMSATSKLELQRQFEALAQSSASVEDLMSLIVGRLKERLPHYDWVGFYMIEPGRPGCPDMLVLGPYVGAPTPHTRIPLNQGICGAAASSGQTIVVDDVNADPRYLACSVETRSEMVAPIFTHGKVVGELDIDSHTPAAFGPEDRALVEHCAALVGRYLESAAA